MVEVLNYKTWRSCQRSHPGCGVFLSVGAVAVKDSVPLSSLEPPAEPAAAEHRSVKGDTSASSNDLQPPCVSTENSNLRPQALKDEDGFEEEEEAGGALTISETAYRFIQSYCINNA